MCSYDAIKFSKNRTINFMVANSNKPRLPKATLEIRVYFKMRRNLVEEVEEDRPAFERTRPTDRKQIGRSFVKLGTVPARIANL
jgi:hypothetical protein